MVAPGIGDPGQIDEIDPADQGRVRGNLALNSLQGVHVTDSHRALPVQFSFEFGQPGLQFQPLVPELVEPLAMIRGETWIAAKAIDLIVEPVELADDRFLVVALAAAEDPAAGLEVVG